MRVCVQMHARVHQKKTDSENCLSAFFWYIFVCSFTFIVYTLGLDQPCLSIIIIRHLVNTMAQFIIYLCTNRLFNKIKQITLTPNKSRIIDCFSTRPKLLNYPLSIDACCVFLNGHSNVAKQKQFCK